MRNQATIACATCPWFERASGKEHGLCMYAPPVIQVIMPPPSPVTGKMQPQVQGLRPPTGENDRCSRHPHWQQRQHDARVDAEWLQLDRPAGTAS